MKNPYEHDWLDDEVLLGRTGQRIALGVFLLFLLVPAMSLLVPSLRPTSEVKSNTTLKESLVSWDSAAKTLPILEQWRHIDQTRSTALFGTGNAKVFAGKERWLYYRPDLEAVFGKGPNYVEPNSVAREKQDRAWQRPLPVIAEFAGELKKRNIRLLFVPVPTKPMVCREGLGLPSGTSTPTAWTQMAEDLTAAGIEFVDLVPLISARGEDAERYLKQDTHWTPETMVASAHEVAAKVGIETAEKDSPFVVETVVRESRGDLVGMLDLVSFVGSRYPLEHRYLRRVIDSKTGGIIPSDADSDVVLLGDSFVNIFEDPELGFGAPGEPSIGAGFASHLALALAKPIQTIAINGGGATAVRESFATLPSDRLAKVKTVVWVLSARDVLLPEIPARRAGIEWRSVLFYESKPVATVPVSGEHEVTATLREASPIEDPTTTPYTAAIFSTLFEVAGEGERLVFLWAFRDRKLESATSLEQGRRYRLRLVPLEEATAANRATRLDDLFRPDLAPWFAESFEPVP